MFPSENEAPEVNAEVVSQDADGVQVQVTIPERGNWYITVPFLNSAEAGMEFISDFDL